MLGDPQVSGISSLMKISREILSDSLLSSKAFRTQERWLAGGFLGDKSVVYQKSASLRKVLSTLSSAGYLHTARQP